MSQFNKQLAKMEMITPVCSYPYKVVPLTEQAKLAFSLFNKKSGPMENRNADVIKKYFNMDKPPFIGQRTFYYDDPNETEEQRKNETKELAIWRMAESWVPGINHPKSFKTSSYKALIPDKDYIVEIGEKIIHEQPEIFTFDDIKAL
jgi:hypothetical protein